MAMNPYIQQQADAIQAQGNQNLAQNVMPGIRSGAQAAGQYGSSRQGIAEGVAAGNAATGIAGAQANLYASGYNTDQANETQRTSIGNNYNLGMGNLPWASRTRTRASTPRSAGRTCSSSWRARSCTARASPGRPAWGQGSTPWASKPTKRL